MFTYFYLPISFISLVTPFFSKLYDILFNLFIKVSEFCSNYLKITIICKEVSGWCVALYYTLLVMCFYLIKNKGVKKIYKIANFSVFVMCFLFMFLNTTLENEVTFLDLDEGDSTLILTHECRALIDTGNGKNNEVLKLLKRKGVKRLDFLFITHPHLDHMGEVEDILNDIRVSNLIVNYYDTNDYGIKAIKVKEGDNIKCGDISFRVLSPKSDMGDENDNSLVLYSEIGGLSMLFLADVSKRVEDLVSKNDLKVDLIKVAHHGSKTSTSTNLLLKYHPKYAVIESGRNQKFNFPSSSVVGLLEENSVVTFITKRDYSVI